MNDLAAYNVEILDIGQLPDPMTNLKFVWEDGTESLVQYIEPGEREYRFTSVNDADRNLIFQKAGSADFRTDADSFYIPTQLMTNHRYWQMRLFKRPDIVGGTRRRNRRRTYRSKKRHTRRSHTHRRQTRRHR